MRMLPEASNRAVPITCLLAIGLLGSGCAQPPGWASFEWPKGKAETSAIQEGLVSDLPAPENLRAVSGELRAVPLAWEPLLTGGISGYRVERAAARKGPFEAIAEITGRLTTTYVDRDAATALRPVSAAAVDREATAAIEADSSPEPALALQDGIRWFYRVRAFAPDGSVAQEASPVIEATTAPPPAPPQNLRAYSRQPRMVPLSWRAAGDSNVIGYRIERSPTSRGPFEPLTELDGRYQTTFVDRGLGDLRVFYFRVASINAAGGVGKASPPVRAVTKPEPLPPVNLRITEQQLGVNRLAWDSNVEEDIVEYRLLRTRVDDEAPTQVATLAMNQTTAADFAVGADEQVSYTVVALDRDGLMSDAAEAIAVESEGYGLSATVRRDGVHLDWDPHEGEGFHGALAYRITPFGKRDFGLQVGSQLLDPEVDPGSTHSYYVVLERPDGSLAPPSAPVQITIPGAGVD